MKAWIKLVLLPGLLLSSAALGADLAVLHNGFSIRHQWHQVEGPVTRLYFSNDQSSFVDVPTEQVERFEKDLSAPPSPSPSSQPGSLDEVIQSISSRQRLDPDLVNSVIHAESGFNPQAVSPKGAQGLMQLMPGTASSLGVSNPFDPSANVEGGTRYLRTLLERYDFNLIKALAAYNAGPRRVEQYHGVPPYYETQAYVARVIRDFNRKKLAEHRAAKPAAARAKRVAAHSTIPQSMPKATGIAQ